MGTVLDIKLANWALPAVAIVMCFLLLGAADRGIQVTVKTSKGKRIELYKNSYALVVGNGNYTAGWDPLPGAIRDVNEVAGALEKNGFQVMLKTDLTKAGFNRAFGEFAYNYGRSKDNRLFFYYAGHGHTQQMATGEELGYLVMVDAPVPEADPMNFSLSSVDMQSLVTQAKMIRARHVLFMFDSCFSGSILNLRERVVPGNITESVQYPVRQFITAGRANEPVPDHSIFKQAFLDLLEGRDKEPIPDGYITGEELGLYLKNKVPLYNPSQHPQYGKIRDIHLDKGDFVFQLAASSGAIVEKPSFEAKVAAALLSVESNIQGVRVLVDGREVGTTPLDDAVVPAGRHKVLVEKNGFTPYQRRLDFEAGRSISLYVDLSEAKPAKARLFVETDPEGARVRILNIVPKFFKGIELDAGRYHVEVSASGHVKKKMWVTLDSGEDRQLSIKLSVAAGPPSVIKNSLDMKFVYIKPGSFMMGSPSSEKSRYGDERQHTVTLTRGFYMQTTEVTQGQWKAVMGNNPSHFNSCGDDCPVEKVSWYNVQEFIRKLNRKEGTDKYQLPTEAEWEYAARAGSGSAFSFGNNTAQLSDYAWYADNSGGRTHAVGQKQPNAWGLYDMRGNVWEWCQDLYKVYLSGSLPDPRGPSSGLNRVDRGGSWSNGARRCRSANRDNSHPADRRYSLGFRLARDL